MEKWLNKQLNIIPYCTKNIFSIFLNNSLQKIEQLFLTPILK